MSRRFTDCTGEAAITFRETGSVDVQDQKIPDNGRTIDIGFDVLTIAVGTLFLTMFINPSIPSFCASNAF